MLERASVIGRSFPLDAVLQLMPPDEREQAQARVFELVRRGLIRPDVRESGRTASASSTRSSAKPSTRRCRSRSAPTSTRRWRRSSTTAGDAAPAVVGFHLEHTCLLRRELGLRDAELARARRASPAARGRGDAQPHRRAGDDLAARAGARPPPHRRSRAARSADQPRHRRALNGGDLPGAESALVEAVDAAVALGRRVRRVARPHRAPVRPRLRRRAPRSRRASRLAKEAIAELEPLGDELALARAWWLSSRAATSPRAAGAREEKRSNGRSSTRGEPGAGVEMVGTLAGLLAQALLHGPTPVDEAIARIQDLRDELGLDPPLRSSIDTSLAGLLRCAATSTRRGVSSGTPPRRTRSSGFASGGPTSRSWAPRSSCSPATPRRPSGSCAPPRRHSTRSAPPRRRPRIAPCSPRSWRGSGGSRRRRNWLGRSPPRRPPTTSSPRSLSRTALARVRAARRLGARGGRAGDRGAAGSWRTPSSPSWPSPRSPPRAEAAAAADDGPEAERLLAEARRIAEAKGATASLAQLACRSRSWLDSFGAAADRRTE